MPCTENDGRSPPVIAAAQRDDALIARAARRAGWAGTALSTAAGDLSVAHGGDGNHMTGLVEIVLEEAERVSHLAEDIESRRRSGPKAG